MTKNQQLKKAAQKPRWIIRTDGSFLPRKPFVFDPLNYDSVFYKEQNEKMGACALIYDGDDLVAQKTIAKSGGSPIQAEALSILLGFSALIDMLCWCGRDSQIFTEEFILLNDNKSLVNELQDMKKGKTAKPLPMREEIINLLREANSREVLCKHFSSEILRWSRGNRYSLEHRWAKLAAEEGIHDSFLRPTNRDLCRRELLLHLEDKRLFQEFKNLEENFSL